MSQIIKKSDESKDKEINTQLALALFTSGISFRVVDNEFFKNFCKLMKPGFKLARRQTIANDYLSEEVQKVSKQSSI